MLSDVSQATVVSGASKLVLSLFFLFLAWFIITVIIMLIFARKNSKRGLMLTVFIVSSVILLLALLLAYLKIDWFISMLNIGQTVTCVGFAG